MPMKAKAESATAGTSLIARLSRRVAGNEEGGSAIKYALIAAGIGATVAATVYSLGTTTAGLYQTIAKMTLTLRLLPRGLFLRSQCIGQPLPRRAGLERLLLAFVRRPA